MENYHLNHPFLYLFQPPRFNQINNDTIVIIVRFKTIFNITNTHTHLTIYVAAFGAREKENYAVITT